MIMRMQRKSIINESSQAQAESNALPQWGRYPKRKKKKSNLVVAIAINREQLNQSFIYVFIEMMLRAGKQ